MRFTVQYIPINKIKPEMAIQMSNQLNKLRSWMRDCVHLLVVRKNKKDGTYTLVSGHDRYVYLQKHTSQKFAPCIVDESKAAAARSSFMHRWRNRRLLSFFPHMDKNRLVPASSSIIRAFLKQEDRFAVLSRTEQIKVLLLALRYKQTAVRSMRAMVDDLLSRH